MAILSCHVSIKLPPKISDGQERSKTLPKYDITIKPRITERQVN